jgi:hypothetical protein
MDNVKEFATRMKHIGSFAAGKFSIRKLKKLFLQNTG